MTLRIGLPSRSSLVHAAGVASAVHSDLLRLDGYDPAAVHLVQRDTEVIFARNRSLPRMLSSGTIDAAFTSSDYVADTLDARQLARITQRTEPIIEASVSLLSRPGAEWPANRVYSSYSVLARQLMREWELPPVDLVRLAGCCETYVFLDTMSASIDVVCTGRTVRVNGMTVLRSGHRVEWGWFFREECSDVLSRRLRMSDAFLERLRGVYTHILGTRDSGIESLVVQCL